MVPRDILKAAQAVDLSYDSMKERFFNKKS